MRRRAAAAAVGLALLFSFWTPGAVARAYAPDVQAARSYAAKKVGPAQFKCLHALWERESRWNPRAHNRRSGAYGIPQALPGSKMRSAGADWKTNPTTQVKWGLRYVSARYGTPCAALAHAQRTGWY